MAETAAPEALKGQPQGKQAEAEQPNGAEAEGTAAAATPGARAPSIADLAARERPDITPLGDESANDRVKGGKGDEEDLAEVTEWLLSDDPVEVITRKMRVRIGGGDEDPREVSWIVRAIPIDAIRQAQREAEGGNRARQRARAPQDYDELKASLRVVVEGTVQPDLKEIANQRGLRDATVLLRGKLHMRPGVITQIAGEIMSLSGFDADDVRTISGN